MSTVTIREFELDPLALLDRVQAGEPLTIVREGRPIAEVRPVPTAEAGRRPYGLAAGRVSVPDDFDAPLSDDVLRAFEGR